MVVVGVVVVLVVWWVLKVVRGVARPSMRVLLANFELFSGAASRGDEQDALVDEQF